MADERETPQLTFAEQSLIMLDRAERAIEALRENLRMADEYLIQARAAERGAVMVERVVVTNQNVQSVGVQVARDTAGRLEIVVTHRGEEASQLIAPNDSEEFDV